MRDLRHALRCGCHGWPWYECPDVVPQITYGFFNGLIMWFRTTTRRGNLKGLDE